MYLILTKNCTCFCLPKCPFLFLHKCTYFYQKTVLVSVHLSVPFYFCISVPISIYISELTSVHNNVPFHKRTCFCPPKCLFLNQLKCTNRYLHTCSCFQLHNSTYFYIKSTYFHLQKVPISIYIILPISFYIIVPISIYKKYLFPSK